MVDPTQARRHAPASPEEFEKRARQELSDWEAQGTPCEDGFTTSHRSVLPVPCPNTPRSPPLPARKRDLH